jgi:hypothetical protein
MRPADLARLNEPYPPNVEPTDEYAKAAIGVRLPNWAVLENELLADFAEQSPYGVKWWVHGAGLGTKRRILFSDQLYCCVTSVVTNITEAALHWLEYLGASDRDSARFTNAVEMGQAVRPSLLPSTEAYTSDSAQTS